MTLRLVVRFHVGLWLLDVVRRLVLVVVCGLRVVGRRLVVVLQSVVGHVEVVAVVRVAVVLAVRTSTFQQVMVMHVELVGCLSACEVVLHLIIRRSFQLYVRHRSPRHDREYPHRGPDSRSLEMFCFALLSFCFCLYSFALMVS